MLFKLIHDKDPFELNPQLRAVPEFECLTPRQMRYVILSTDYKSPYRKLTPEDRRYHAAVTAGYKYEKGTISLDINARNLVNGKVGTVVAAINKYNAIQKDEDYETLLSVSSLITQIRNLNNQEDKSTVDLEKAVSMTLKLDKLVETKKKLEEILSMREDEVDPNQNMAQPDEDSSINIEDLPILSQLNEAEFQKSK